jgi:hypothetical protein
MQNIAEKSQFPSLRAESTGSLRRARNEGEYDKKISEISTNPLIYILQRAFYLKNHIFALFSA